MPTSVLPFSLPDSDFPLLSLANSADTTSVCTPSIECPNSGSIASPSVLPLASSPVPPSDYPLRKSSRSHKPLSYLQDYSCNSISKPIASGPYDIAHHVSNAHLSTSHRSFVLASSSTTELESFHQAVQSSDWRAAMDKEITDLESTHTWEVVTLPFGKVPIGCKWIYRIKYNPDGSVERYKVRLVANGYT